MPPSLYNLDLRAIAELRTSSPRRVTAELRSDRYADAVRRAGGTPIGSESSPLAGLLRGFAAAIGGPPSRLAAH